MSAAFGIGTIVDLFHIICSRQRERDRLKSLVTDGVMLVAVNFSILADIPSGPLDLLVSKDERRSNTSSSVQRYSSGHTASSIPWDIIGGWEVLKHE